MTATVTDLFCGAGGSSLGAAGAGLELKLAANHWQTAIDVHQAHFPDAAHDCADISQVDPRRYPRTDVLLASPECFTAGHLVTTEHGQVPIEDITVGTVVLTHTGGWKPVVRVQQRMAQTVVVKGQGHTGIECTANHSFWSRGSGRVWNNEIRDYRRLYSTPGWLAAEHLAETESVWATPVEIDPLEEVDPPLIFGHDAAAWWLVGRWLGDGSVMVSRNEVTISCGHHEAIELRERLAETDRNWRENTIRTATNFTVSDGKAAEWLASMCGSGAGSKVVPSPALTMPRSLRRALLDGYLSADGGLTQRRIRCSTVSRALGVSVRLLAESLGHRVAMAHDRRTTYSIEGRTGTARLQWVLHWEPTLAAGRQPEAFEEHGHAWSRVRSVRPGRVDVPVFNIEVADDHSYVLDGIVVKNCTNHSQARGVSRKRQDPSLWDAPDPAAERSRATMWDVPRFAEQMIYDAIVVENVVEATKWVGWRGWSQTMADLGYERRILSHNSMHHGVPQSRDRIYVVFWRKGAPAPDLELELQAWCPRCDAVRTVRQGWKNGRTVGRYRQQWTWNCISCSAVCEPETNPAASIIDWDLDCPRIGDRAKPLAAKTRARILAGLERYGWAPVVTVGAGNGYERTPGNRARPLTDPVPTQTTTAQHGMATPPGFLVQTAGDHRRVGVNSLDDPHPTVCASDDRQSLVVPMRANGNAYDPDAQPLGAVTAGGLHHGLLMRNNSGGAEMVTPTEEPARSITTKGHQSLLMPYYGQSIPHPADRPIGTVTTRDRYGVIDPDQIVDDCGFRMLEPHEIAAAMDFPVGYIPAELTKKDQVKLAGNAVTPSSARWICGRVLQALESA